MSWHLKSRMKNVSTLQHLVFSRRSYIFKQTCSWKLQVCLSMYDLLKVNKRNSIKVSVVVSKSQTQQKILENLIFFYCNIAEEYLESCRRFKMDCFAKMVNGLKPLFPGTLHLRCFTGFWIRLFWMHHINIWIPENPRNDILGHQKLMVPFLFQFFFLLLFSCWKVNSKITMWVKIFEGKILPRFPN